MRPERLAAFSDGVLAIIITIMVLEMKVPHGGELATLVPVLPVFGSYVLSFFYVGIYWNNHHHLLHTLTHTNGMVLWANLHLLFWLSLLPFCSGWLGENHFAMWPTVLYGVVLFCAGFAYFLLQAAIMRVEGPQARLAKALGRDLKSKASIAIYVAAIALAFVQPLLSCALYVLVALIWLVPDRRIERMLGE